MPMIRRFKNSRNFVPWACDYILAADNRGTLLHRFDMTLNEVYKAYKEDCKISKREFELVAKVLDSATILIGEMVG